MEGTRVGAPIAGAELAIVDGINVNTRVRSDAGGHFVFDALTADKFTVNVSAPGYVSVTPVINLARDTDANFALKPQ